MEGERGIGQPAAAYFRQFLNRCPMCTLFLTRVSSTLRDEDEVFEKGRDRKVMRCDSDPGWDEVECF